MTLLNILRFFRGYVKFTIEGGFTERFINLCAANNIHIWGFIPSIGSAEGCITASGFAKLRSIVRKSGVKLKIKDKSGLPFILRQYRHRAVLLSGFVLFIVFIITMNKFVWLIEVTGTDTVSHEEIIYVLEQYGLKKGAYAPSVDEISLSRNGVNCFNGRLMWMSVNIKGSKAVIEVRDYVDEHEDTTYKEPSNIVADFDGTILSIETFNGDKAVKAGVAVKKGDLLISGVIENRDMSADYLDASGKITALHQVDFSKSYNPDSALCIKLCDTKKGKRLELLGMEIPLYLPGRLNGTKLEYKSFITADNTELPFGMAQITSYSTIEDEISDRLYLYYIDDFIKDYYYSFRNTNIIERDLTFICTDTGYSITSTQSCIDYMGVKSRIYVEG